MPGTVVIARDREVSKAYKSPCFFEAYILVVVGEKDNIYYIIVKDTVCHMVLSTIEKRKAGIQLGGTLNAHVRTVSRAVMWSDLHFNKTVLSVVLRIN